MHGMFSGVGGAPQSNLLARIVRFLDAKDLNIESIHELINESATSQLVPAFAFLSYWLSTNANSDKVQPTIVQAVYHIIQDIANKVPPVILFSGISDLNWNSHQPHVTNTSFLRLSYDRLQAIRDLATPSSVHNRILRWPHAFDHKMHGPFDKFPILSEVESDPNYQLENALHVQKLICNRCPIESFALMTRQKNSKLVITWAIIELIRKLNFRRNIKHVELLYMFQNVISYAVALAKVADIDGQLLCQFIQTLPTVSPFLMLALVNHISVSDYLFSFLLPPKIAMGNLTTEEAREAFFAHYRFVDMSDDNTLDAFLEVVPEVVFRFFLTQRPEPRQEVSGTGLSSVMINCHTFGRAMGERAKYFLKEATTGIDPAVLFATPWQTKGMALQIIFYHRRRQPEPPRGDSTQRPEVWKVICAILAEKSPMMSDHLEKRLLIPCLSQDEKSGELLLRQLLKYGLYVLVDWPVQRGVVPFLLDRLKLEMSDMASTARFALAKLLLNGIVRISEAVINALKVCEDLFTVLEYIEALDGFMQADQFDELKQLNELRDFLIAKLPFTSHTSDHFWISLQPDPRNPTRANWNKVSMEMIEKVRTVVRANRIDMIPQGDLADVRIVRILCVCENWMTNHEPAKFLAVCMTKALRNQDIVYGADSEAPLRVCDLALPTAQVLLKRLLFRKHADLALILLSGMEEILKNEMTPQHWLFMFTQATYHHLTPDVRQRLMAFAQQLPSTKDCYVRQDANQVREMMRKLSGTGISLNQDPSVIEKEYQSSSRRLETYYVICLLLGNASVDALVDQLIVPFFDRRFLLKDKTIAFESMARMIADMPKEIGISFIKQVMSRPLTKDILTTLRLIVVHAPLDMFRDVCGMTSVLIHQDQSKLRPFMSVIMPNINRLKSDEETATRFLCGLLESVDSSMPIELQESVIDAVGLVYVMYKLHKSRTQLISAAKQFSPELKAIIASSLDVDFDFGQKCRGTGDKVGSRDNVQRSSMVFWQ